MTVLNRENTYLPLNNRWNLEVTNGDKEIFIKSVIIRWLPITTDENLKIGSVVLSKEETDDLITMLTYYRQEVFGNE